MASVSSALNFSAVACDSRRRSGRVSAAIHSSATAASQASLYQVLRVPMGATAPEIKAAYRRLARVLHPDVNGGGGETGGDFMSVHEAYSILRDPKKRADYDRTLFRQRRMGSRSYTVLTAAGNSYSGYSGRSWETDQCW